MQTVSTKCRQRKMRALKHLNRARPAWQSAEADAAAALKGVPEPLAGQAERLERAREDLGLVSALAEAQQARGDVAGTIQACDDALTQARLVRDLTGILVKAVADHKLAAQVTAA